MFRRNVIKGFAAIPVSLIIGSRITNDSDPQNEPDDSTFELEWTDVPDTVFEGGMATLEFEVRNPGSSKRTQQVSVTALRETHFDEVITLGPGESTRETISWYVPATGAGHSVVFKLGSDNEEVEEIVSIVTTFRSSIKNIDPDTIRVGDTVTVKFEISNNGTAPGSQNVIVKLDDGVLHDERVHLSIGRSQVECVTFAMAQASHELQIITESGTLIETFDATTTCD